VPQLTEFMVSMMNVRGDTILSYGKPSQIASIAFLLPPLLMKRFYVCMVV